MEAAEGMYAGIASSIRTTSTGTQKLRVGPNYFWMSQPMTGSTLAQSLPWIWLAWSGCGQRIPRSTVMIFSESCTFSPIVEFSVKRMSTSTFTPLEAMHQHKPPTAFNAIFRRGELIVKNIRNMN